MKLRVAGFQMPVGRDVRANSALILGAIEQAAAAGAELLLTPEGSLSGYRPDFPVEVWKEELARVTARARERRLGLALGTCAIEEGGRCYNQIRLYRPDGAYLGFHAKTLLCGTLGPKPEGEIRHYLPAPLQCFDWAPGCRLGALICNDVWANPSCTPMADPHLTQRLAELGARVILHAVNGGRDASELSQVHWQFHESNLRLRAQAGGVWIVTVDNSDPATLPTSSPSGVVRPDGTWACRAPAAGAHLFVHELDLGDARPSPR